MHDGRAQCPDGSYVGRVPPSCESRHAPAAALGSRSALSTFRAVVFSIAIHAALLLVVATLRYAHGPPATARSCTRRSCGWERSPPNAATRLLRPLPAEKLANAAEAPPPSAPPPAAPPEPPQPRVAEPAAESEPTVADEPSSTPIATVTQEAVPSPVETAPQRVVAGDEPAPAPRRRPRPSRRRSCCQSLSASGAC